MKKAFTLIELLVVIAIIAILAAILFPVFAQAKLAAKKAVSISNQKQQGLSLIMYAGDYDDALPVTVNGQLSRMQNRKPGQLTINCPGPGTQDLPDPEAAGRQPTLAWPGEILPYFRSRGLFVDPARGDSHQIWAPEALTPGDPNYDPEGATLRNQNRFPMYGYNYMFLSPLRIPKDERGLPNAMQCRWQCGVHCRS